MHVLSSYFWLKLCLNFKNFRIFRAKLESFRENGIISENIPTPTACLSPSTPLAPPVIQGRKGIAEEIERQLHSPQHVEMHAFRDAIDVNYQRMALTGEELSGASLVTYRDD